MSEIFQAIESGDRKILVRSCNGAGKTTALAAICNWYFYTYGDSIVLTTASSWTQVKRNLWGEIRRQARNAKLYKDPNDPEKLLKLNETSILLSDKHFMIGISPDVPENAMGFHAPHLLIAVDEATGLNREIFDALTGNLTGSDAQIVMICNPIDMQSFPYEAEQSGDWQVITISAFDHPNVDAGEELIKGAVTQTWIEDRLNSWSHELSSGADRNDIPVLGSEIPFRSTPGEVYISWLRKRYRATPIVQARILGEWADMESEGLIPMELLQAACQTPSSKEGEVKCLGVDIARGGEDATVFAFFAGNCQLEFKTMHEKDLMAIAHRIKRYYDEGFQIIALDDTGVGGGVTDRLKEFHLLDRAGRTIVDGGIYPVNFAQAAKGLLRNNKDLANARAEMYFALLDELRAGSLRLLDHKQLLQELAAIRLSITENTLAFRLEDKELTRRRLGRSPDFADATALARYGLRLREIAKPRMVL
ncbi:MAG TPA: hypothetical protein VFH95_11265 [Candidatus Kapabacteria bacterium]|nr:hypothetical protein [Candidatus Kapabacteria bacterium]